MLLDGMYWMIFNWKKKRIRMIGYFYFKYFLFVLDLGVGNGGIYFGIRYEY